MLAQSGNALGDGVPGGCFGTQRGFRENHTGNRVVNKRSLSCVDGAAYLMTIAATGSANA